MELSTEDRDRASKLGADASALASSSGGSRPTIDGLELWSAVMGRASVDAYPALAVRDLRDEYDAGSAGYW